MTNYLVINKSDSNIVIARPADNATVIMLGRDIIRTDWFPEESKTDSRLYVKVIPEEVINIDEIREIEKEVKDRVEKLKAERIAERERTSEIKKVEKKVKNTKKEVD